MGHSYTLATVACVTVHTNAGVVACGVASDATSPEMVLTQQGLNAEGASTELSTLLPFLILLFWRLLHS